MELAILIQVAIGVAILFVIKKICHKKNIIATYLGAEKQHRGRDNALYI